MAPALIVLVAVLCGAVVVIVVAPLVWAILTQHRDLPVAALTATSRTQAQPEAAHRTRRPRYEPSIRPAR
jgi:hypothetical protein